MDAKIYPYHKTIHGHKLHITYSWPVFSTSCSHQWSAFTVHSDLDKEWHSYKYLYLYINSKLPHTEWIQYMAHNLLHWQRYHRQPQQYLHFLHSKWQTTLPSHSYQLQWKPTQKTTWWPASKNTQQCFNTSQTPWRHRLKQGKKWLRWELLNSESDTNS